MEKRIKECSDYAITEDGKVISYKYKNPKIMKTWYQKSGYENIKLRIGNESKHFLIHRLVAEAFIPNPNNLPEVNHKDNNPKNNNVENLEWCTRKENLEQSYFTLGPTRNTISCYLTTENSEEPIEYFTNIKTAAHYANQHFGCSIAGMIRNYKSKGYVIHKRSND